MPLCHFTHGKLQYTQYVSNRRALNLLQWTKQHERTNQYIQAITVHPTGKMLY